MNIFREYINYLKDNPEGYWFKRKLYGWGWTPSSWQGWLIVSLYVFLIIIFSLTIDENSPLQEIMFTFVLPVVLLTVALVRIAYKKGEKPKWMWGLPKKPEDN